MPLQDTAPYAGHSPRQERALGGYAALMGFYSAAVACYATWFARSSRELPLRVDAKDLALGAVAVHKASRLLTKDRVSSGIRAPFTEFQGDAGPGEVDEAARGRGLRRAVGELLVCPYCLGVRISTAFVGGLTVAPRATRGVASMLSIVFASDVLQIAYAKAEDAL